VDELTPAEASEKSWQITGLEVPIKTESHIERTPSGSEFEEAEGVNPFTLTMEPSPDVDKWTSLLQSALPELNRRKLREIQERLGAHPENPVTLEIEWPPTLEQPRALFNQFSQYWLKPSLWAKLMQTEGPRDFHHHLEKPIAYRLWRLLKRMGVPAQILDIKKTSRITKMQAGHRTSDALSYALMTRTIYGANLPDITLHKGPLKNTEGLKEEKEIETRVALPNYYEEKNEELTRSIAERLVRLKAVELIGKEISDFHYEIKNINGQRYLLCRARIWL